VIYYEFMGKRKRKHKAVGTDESISNTPLTPTMSTMNFTPNMYNSTDMMASSNHVLYGTPQSFHLSPPNQPGAPHTTPAINQQPPPFQQSYPQTCLSPQIMQPGLEKYFNEINNKLSKLDLLDSIVQRLSSLETQYDVFRTEMVQIKTEMQNIHMKVDGGENRSQLMETKMHELERQNDDLHQQNCDMSEEFLKLQTHTMKDNLLFYRNSRNCR